MRPVIFVSLALLAETSCASAEPNDGSRDVGEPSEYQLEISRKRERALQALKVGTELWQSQGPDSYVYVGKLSCFCSEGTSTNPVRVVVEAGQVVSAQDTLDLSDQRERAHTIDARLEEARVQALREDTDVEGVYDAALGYPLEFISGLRGYSDARSSFRISCFSELKGDEACPMPAFSAGQCAAQGGAPTQSSNLSGGLCDGTREPLIELTPSGSVCCP